jgi:two-component system OmpR family response regulator
MRVLVVEDEALLARQLTAALRRAGYAVDHAADGERADLLGHDERYDAVVLDLGLPKVDGLTLLRRWREAGQAMPVLVFTITQASHCLN